MGALNRLCSLFECSESQIPSYDLSRFLGHKNIRQVHQAVSDSWIELNNQGHVTTLYSGPSIACYRLSLRHCLLLVFRLRGDVAEAVRFEFVNTLTQKGFGPLHPAFRGWRGR